MTTKRKRKESEIIKLAQQAKESSKLLQELAEAVLSGSGAPPKEQEARVYFGKYDGEFMVTESGEKFSVPSDYASKASLVYGDKLKMVNKEEGEDFKKTEGVPRFFYSARLVLKDGKFSAVADIGRYKVLSEAVEHLGLKEGDALDIIIPRDNKNVPFAAISASEKRKQHDSPSEGKGNKPKADGPKRREEKRRNTRSDSQGGRGGGGRDPRAKHLRDGAPEPQGSRERDPNDPGRILEEDDLR